MIIFPGTEPNRHDGYMKVTLSEESAEALARVPELETWPVEPTMARGRRKVAQAKCKPVAGPRRKLNARRVMKRVAAVQKRLKKKVAKEAPVCKPGKEGEPDPINRTTRGRATIQSRLTELRQLEGRMFKENPLFDTEGFCRMQYEAARVMKWKDILLHAPACLETMYLR